MTTRRPGVAGLLSALLPGLGQAWLGERRRGALIALPFVAVVAIALGALLLNPRGAIETALRSGALVAALVIAAVMAVYHLAAVFDAVRLGSRLRAAADPEPTRRRQWALLAPLPALALAAVLTVYGTLELVGVKAYQAAQVIFVDPSSGFQIPEASFAPRPTATPGVIPTGPVTAPPPPTATPAPVPAWAEDGRLNLLLIGSDAGPGRWLARMDSINVVSVEIATGRVALFSLWRYTANVPLPPESAGAFKGGIFPDYLNALYVYAMGHPNQFPGGDARGFRATAGSVQELIGQSSTARSS